MEIQEGQNIHNRKFVDSLEEKWDPYLQHIDKSPNPFDYRRKTTAMVLENTVKEMPRQLKRDSMLQEADAASTTTGGVADYASTIFPVLMRVFPNLIAHELVSIQPMGGPVGAVFYMEYKHGTNKGATTKGSNLIENFDENYTSSEVTNEHIATGNGSDYGGAGSAMTASLSFAPVFPLNAGLSSPEFKVVIQEVDASGNVQQEAVDDGSGGFTGNISSGSIDYDTGAITNFVFTAAPSNTNKIVASYFYDMESNSNVPKVSLDVSVNEIKAKSRKLNVIWSSEAADDLRALHGIEGEAQLLAGVSNEIGLEIDREILKDLRQNADTTDTFDLSTPPTGVAQIDFLRELITKIHQTSSKIHKKSKRAQANWIVTSPEVSALLNQFQGHSDYTMLGSAPDRSPSYGEMTSDYGIYQVGLLMGRMKVYVDPFFQSDELLLGIKGKNYLDAGMVYSPYVPLQMTQTFLDPEDQTYKKGLRTRYAKKLLRPSHYGRIKVLGLA